MSVTSRGCSLTESDDIERVLDTVTTFITNSVSSAEATGVVVGMSGGIDSTLTAALATEALGSDRVLGLGLPARKADDHTRDARTIAEGLGIEFSEISLRPIVDQFKDHVATEIEPVDERRAVGNIVARLRMATLYYAANTQSRLVLGTANRSELLLGYFTKFGDGVADLFPLGDLYKTEIQAIAQHSGLPRRIIAKEPTADFWMGQTDAGDLGARYSVIDPILRCLVEDRKRIEEVVEELDADPEVVADVAERYVNTMHKRVVPPTPGVDDRG